VQKIAALHGFECRKLASDTRKWHRLVLPPVTDSASFGPDQVARQAAEVTAASQ
jgi:hypothetical protein